MKICEVTQSALSPEFLRWFAGSKVVNPDGSPKVVFHGTAHDFDQFDRTKDIGYHFASSDVANRRLDMIQRYERSSLKGAGGLNLIPAYLRLTKPVYMSSDPGAWYSEFIILDLGRTNSLPVPVVQQLRQFYDEQVSAAQTQFNQENGGSFEPAFPGQLPPKKRHRAWATVIDATNRVILARIKETLIQHGYDGIIYPNEVEGTGHRTRAKRAANPNNISYVVFSPNQIKGAFNDRPVEGPKFMESVQISGTMIAGEPPIVRFRRDAARIEASLPPVPFGHVRLWRGNRPGEIGRAQSFTSDLPGIALPFREPYGGDISYVDVPEAQLPVASRGGAPGVEFFLPREISAMARPVGVEVS